MLKVIRGLLVVGCVIVASAISADVVKLGRDAFQSGDFRLARRVLEPLAQTGNGEAAHLMGRMFDEGLGTVQNYVRAFEFYTLGADNGSAESVESIQRILPRMSAPQLAEAKSNLSQLEFDPDQIDSCFSVNQDLSGSLLADAQLHSYRPGADIQKMVEDVYLYTAGTAPDFRLLASSDPRVNAAAFVSEDDRRYIMYNPRFFAGLGEASGPNWKSYSIIAHEVGHHIDGHTLDRNSGSRPPEELKADEFSGFIMSKMGATIQQAQDAMRLLASEEASDTHPAKRDRLAAIDRGYQRGLKTGGGPRTVETPRPEPVQSTSPEPKSAEEWPGSSMPMPPQQRVATACVTLQGACAMAWPMPPNQICHCVFYPYGSIPGISR